MTNRIRVLHVLDSLGKGGMENGLVNLIQTLSDDRYEHFVCAVRGLGENAERLVGRTSIVCLQKKDSDSRFQVRQLYKTIRQVSPNVVHSRNWGSLEATVAARAAGIAAVHSEHGLDSETPGDEPLRRVYFRRFGYRMANQVVTVSQALKQIHARAARLSAQRITVIHNGVDHLRFSPDPTVRSKVRRELGISENCFCIGMVGNLFPVKDYVTGLRAIERLAQSNLRPACLLVIGDGPERSRLQALTASSLQLSSCVRFLGSSSRVPELLNAFDVYLLSSLSEGISNSLLEAMATRLPVIATRAGGNPEVVEDGVSGILFPVSDHVTLALRLEALRNSPELRERVATGALLRVREHFSLQSMARQYDATYHGVLPRRDGYQRTLRRA